MKRGVVFFAVVYAISVFAYWIALTIVISGVEALDTPGWWMRLFRNPFRSINIWHDLALILAVLIVAVLIGLGLARLVGRHAIPLALGCALTVVAVATLPVLIIGRLGPWPAPRFFDALVLATIAFAPALIASATRVLPSNNRWRVP